MIRQTTLGVLFGFGMILLPLGAIQSQPMQMPGQQGPMARGLVVIQGSVTNGTTGVAVAADEIALMRPGQGMQVLETIKPSSSVFKFAPVEAGNGPLLVRATFQGENYIQVIPPTARATGSFQKVMVYETGAKPSDIMVTSGMQVIKKKETLHISRVYALENRSNPPRSYRGNDLKIFIPSGATDVQNQLQHQGSMPLPNVLGVDGVLSRSLRPGSAELTIEYDVEGTVLEERPHQLAGSPAVHPFIVLLHQPADAKPVFQGGEADQVEIPDLGPALRVRFTADSMKMDFSAGGYVVDNPMKADSNAIFDERWKMTAAFILTVLILFLGASLVSSSGFRLVKKNDV